MAESLTYYEKNVLRSLANWNILSNASISDTGISISSGGVAGVDLGNEYNNGLKASRYRKLLFTVQADISDKFNYENYIELIMKIQYKDSEGNILVELRSVNATYRESTSTDSGFRISRVLDMENYDLVSCTVYVANHTTDTIVLTNCEMKRSQDINSSQVSESIGLSVTLREVAEYLDGIELYYDGVDTPDRLWWMDDENDQLCGVNVNNERMIKLSRHNTILLD